MSSLPASGGADPFGFLININVTKKGKQIQQTYQRGNTQIIWMGKTGRLKEMYWWIRIKDPEKECYVTISGNRKFSFNLNKIFRQEVSGLYNKLKDLGYRVVLDMPSLWIQKLVGWLCTLAMFGITAYVFLVDELTGKNGLVLSKTMQIFFGCLILLASIFLACAIYFNVRNLPPISAKDMNKTYIPLVRDP